MTVNGILQIVLYMIVLTALVKPLGGYMARVYQAEPCGLERILGPLERLLYRFITNTNWQAYGGESTLSYLSQMMGLGVQNFVSAAQGMAVLY